MVDRVPVKAVIVSGSVTGLAEYAAGDTVPVANGGTGASTVAGIKTALDIANVTDSAVAGKLPLTGGSAAAMTGNLYINKGAPTAFLQKTGNLQEAAIYAYQGTNPRWGLALGDASSETGSNAGCDFALYRYADNGSFLGTAMSIIRSTGVVTFNNAVQTSSNVYAALGFSALGTANNWVARSTSYQIEGSYRTVYGVSMDSTGDTANLRAWHNPGVESFVRLSVGGSGHYMQVNNSGVGIFTGGYGGTSDQRVKYDNQRITGALDKVDQLHGYTFIRADMYGMKGKMPRRAGLIAQDVLKVLPEAVFVPENYNAEKWQGDLLALESAGVIGLLVEAVKEQRAEVKALRAEVALLRLGANATGAVDATVKAVTSPLKLTSP